MDGAEFPIIDGQVPDSHFPRHRSQSWVGVRYPDAGVQPPFERSVDTGDPLPDSVELGQAESVAFEAEPQATTLPAVRGMFVRAVECECTRARPQPSGGYFERTLRVADFGVQHVERLVVGRGFVQMRAGQDSRLLKRSTQLRRRRKGAVNGELAAAVSQKPAQGGPGQGELAGQGAGVVEAPIPESGFSAASQAGPVLMD